LLQDPNRVGGRRASELVGTGRAGKRGHGSPPARIVPAPSPVSIAKRLKINGDSYSKGVPAASVQREFEPKTGKFWLAGAEIIGV
jgi:hypothetical protein